MDSQTVLALALAAGLGLLVGLQREWAGPHLAGIRTFPLLTLLGAAVGLLSSDLGAWPVAATVVGVAVLLATGYVVRSREPDHGTGLTTACAALTMTVSGVAAGLGRLELSIILGGAVVVLLQWKQPLHRMVGRVGEKDIHAIMRMALLGLIVLPILPDRNLGPYGVLNPFEVWLVVVLICGISLVSYLLYRFLGTRAGVLLGGLLGGLISSTATTISQSRIARKSSDSSDDAAIVIVVASAAVFPRVLFEVGVVSPGVLPDIAAQLGVMAAVMTVLSGVLVALRRRSPERIAEPEDPLELKTALLFGLTFVVILLLIAFLEERVGDDALYPIAVLSGLTDVDAITLSTARMVEKGDLSIDTGWRMILLGAMSNLVFKAGVVVVLGSRRTAALVGAAFGVTIAAGGVLLAAWP